MNHFSTLKHALRLQPFSAFRPPLNDNIIFQFLTHTGYFLSHLLQSSRRQQHTSTMKHLRQWE